MKEVSLENYPWCSGTGTDTSIAISPCFDCEATGYKEGKRAEAYFYYLIDQKEKKMIEKGLL